MSDVDNSLLGSVGVRTLSQWAKKNKKRKIINLDQNSSLKDKLLSITSKDTNLQAQNLIDMPAEIIALDDDQVSGESGDNLDRGISLQIVEPDSNLAV